MKRRFTILTAALALLTFLAVPMGMWGQTRTNQTAFYGFETGDAGWTATSFVTNNTAVTAHGGSKYGATNSSSSADVNYNTIVESPQSLTCYYTKTSTNPNAGSKFHIQVSSNNSTWTTVASGLGMDQVTKGTWYELTADLSSYSNVYVRVHYDGTSAVRALDDITLIYDDGTAPSTDPEITFTPSSITLDEVMVGNEVSTTFSVGQANLTSDIALSVDNGSLSTSSIAQGAAATTVTWTYTPTTAGAISATVTATSGTATETLAISGTAIAPMEGYDVDFEYATDMYPNWTFENMTTYQTGSITAHGGTYYGTTGGKATASISTTSTVANPGTLTCYVSKQSGNTSSSTWYIQVSENGSTWTEVESHSATSMSQGSWVEFTADLTDYTDVYVRVYYSGSTAIRNIDDLTLTTVEPSSAVATTTTINLPQNFNTDIYQGTTAGTLTATVSAEGTPISGATVTWSSSNTGVATIDANGEVTLVAVGTTTITASYAGVEDEYRPSTGTYELTVIDSNAPGTQNNPYTVAQAIAATPSSGNVYIQGIVSSFYSTSIVDDGSNYRYYISDDGTTTTELLVYRGTGLNQAPFTNADDLLVGDEVVICGTLTMYHDAPEINSGNYLYSWNRPSITEPSVIVTPNTINAPFAGAEGTLTLTYENIEEFISFDYYFCDANGNELEDTDPDYPGDWIDAEINEENEAYTLSYIIDANDGEARTAYMKVYTFDDNLEEVYVIVTVNQAQYVIDYATLPFEWEGGASADFLALNGVTALGLGSDYGSTNAPYLIKFDGTGDYIQVKTNEQPGKVTIGVKMIGGASTSTITIQGSADGETFTDVEELTISGAQNDVLTLETTNAFAANVRYVRMLFTKGSNVGVGPISIAVVSNEASIAVNPDEVNVDAEEHDGTLDLTYENLTITDMTDFDIQFCDANGDELSEQPDWIEVLVAEQDPTIGEGYVVSYYMVENEGTDARTAYFKVYASLGEGLENVYSNLVTVTQAEYEAPSSWVLTDLADLTPADVFVIVGDNGDTYALPSTETSSSPNAVAVTVNTATTPYSLANAPAASLQWNLVLTEDGYVFYPYQTTGIWLNCTNSNNGVRVSNTAANAKHFSMDDESGYLTTTETTNQRYLGVYSSQDWRTYENTTGNIANQSFSFYKKVTDPVTYTKDDIAAYVGEKDNYYLIASPVASVTPSASNGFLTNDYDLYYFDDSQDKEWINHEAGAFNLVSGKGYLYANNGENVTLTFTGAPYFGNGLVPLQYTDDARFAGWNLIGNPFNTNATLNMPYYRLNADGSGLSTTTENTAVNVMEGVFVQATAANAEAVFTQASSGAKSISQLNLKVTRNRGNVVDNAIIRFDEGATLGKFQLNENSTKVYFTQNDKDFAVVRSNSEGEMPVSFKAAENGNYTFSVEPESLEVSYLHLIDNLTGTDVDLLATPSYSFEARTTDYANRFRLVFNTNGVEENNTTANFAYFNGSSWTVNNMGEATLQVVDMMGRVISTETISGNTEVNLNQAAGVYMLRLVTGNDVKVQKVVVR